MSQTARSRWRLVAACTLAGAAVALCGGLVAIAIGGVDSADPGATAESGPLGDAFSGAFTDGPFTDGFTDGLTGGLTDGLTDGFLSGSTPTDGDGGSGGGAGGPDRPISALWTGVGIGAIVALLAGCVVLLRRSRPPEATDEGPDFWAEDETTRRDEGHGEGKPELPPGPTEPSGSS